MTDRISGPKGPPLSPLAIAAAVEKQASPDAGGKSAAADSFEKSRQSPLGAMLGGGPAVELGAAAGKYIGETEKNLRRELAHADSPSAALTLDEADALLGRRTEVKDSHDRYADIETSYRLGGVGNAAGLAPLSSNLKAQLADVEVAIRSIMGAIEALRQGQAAATDGARGGGESAILQYLQRAAEAVAAARDGISFPP